MELRKNIGNILMTKWRETLDRDDEDKKKKRGQEKYGGIMKEGGK